MLPGKIRVAYGNRIRELHGQSYQNQSPSGARADRTGATTAVYDTTNDATDDPYAYQTTGSELRSELSNQNRVKKHKFEPMERVSLVGNKRVSFAE